MKIEVSEVVRLPPSRVFELLCDLQWIADSIKSIVRIEFLSGAHDGSPFGVGVRWSETRVMMGKEATEIMEVSAVDNAQHAYTITSNSCGTEYTSLVRVDTVPEGSKMVMVIDAVPQTCFAQVMSWVMSPFMSGSMKNMMQQDLVEIREAAERLQKTGGDN